MIEIMYTVVMYKTTCKKPRKKYSKVIVVNVISSGWIQGAIRSSSYYTDFLKVRECDRFQIVSSHYEYSKPKHVTHFCGYCLLCRGFLDPEEIRRSSQWLATVRN